MVKGISDNQESEEEKISRINAAGIINVTLENLWKDVFNSLSQGNLVIWNRKLDCIWSILGGDVKEGDNNDKEMKALNERIYSTGSLNHKRTGFKKIEEDESTKMSMQYILLNEKNLFLRRLQNKQGKGTAYQRDDDDDFD